jgi:type II secretory pathway component GspD/PulD (secretin)
LDLLNSVLLNKGWTIVRRGRLVMLLNLELGAEVPQELLELVPLSELDQRGDFELVKSIFSLAKMSPEDAEGEIARLIGPGRTMIVLPKARQILVTETAGKLRVIRSVIEAIENPDGDRKKVIEVKLKHVLAETVLVTARPLLALEPDVNTNDQINIATDAFGSRIFATGTEEAIEQLREIVVLMDIEHEESELAGPALEAPDLRTYPISAADPATVNEVLQTLMAGLPDVRLAIDPLSNKLIAMARPSDHQLIVATLQKLEGDAPRFEVIQLRITEPDLMVMSINKLMGITEEGGPDGLQVDADITARRLLIRGTSAQIAQIQDLVVKLEGESGVYNDSPMRFIPMDSRQTDQLLGQVEAFWPQVSKTKIRILAPADPNANNGVREIEISPSVEPIVPPTNPLVPPQPPRRERLEETSVPSMTRTAAEVSQFVFFPQQPETAGDASPSDVAPVVIQRDENAATGDSPIVIQRAPGGIWIYGEPKELNQLEELLNRLNMANGAGSGLVSQEIGVYYLRHTTAEVATQLLGDILGATSSSSSLIGDMATNMIGGMGGGMGGMLGALMGGGGSAPVSTLTTGTMTIVPDPRLNRLIIMGSGAELDQVEELLKIIDKDQSITDIETAGRPWVIPIIYTEASKIADVVNGAFAGRVGSGTSTQGGRGGQQQRGGSGGSPEDLIRMMRGGGRSSQPNRGALPKMTVTVHEDSNSLIVMAPEPLYKQVLQLVEEIDRLDEDYSERIVVIGVEGVNPEVMQQALGSVFGNVGSSGSSPTNPSSSQNGSNSNSADAAAAQRRQEFLQRIMGARGGGGGGSGFSGFGSRGGSPTRGGGFQGFRGGTGGGTRGGPGGGTPGGPTRGSGGGPGSGGGRGR